MAKAQPPQRGEIWMVQFGPSVGAEIRKIRPAVVVSLDTVGRLPLRIVVPLTDWQDPFALLPWFVHLPLAPGNGLTKDSGADAFQVSPYPRAGSFAMSAGSQPANWTILRQRWRCALGRPRPPE